MSERRRLLLAIANQFKWLPYSYTNLYYDLVPQTISGKTVRNKAKVSKIYANSEVVNQLVNTTDTSITLGTHKYLTFISGTWSIITGTSQTLSVNGGSDMVIDLTQMFPFDTPTTLTDKRVQNILNRGYMPYNTGEIKGTDIGEISTTKSDTTALDTISFKYQGAGVGTSHDTLERTDTEWVFEKVMNRYTFSGSEGWSVGGQISTGLYRYYYIKSDMLLGSAQSGLCDKLPTDFTEYNTTTQQAIRFGQSNSAIYVYLTQDLTATDVQTFMAGKTIEYPLATPQTTTIPRKRLGVVDLGTIDFGNLNHNRINSGIISNLKANGYCYCSKYISQNTPPGIDENGIIGIGSAKVIYISDSSFVGLTSAQIQAKLSGVLFFYETENEVEDMPFLLGIESGGTITTDSEVLPNVDFEMKCK